VTVSTSGTAPNLQHDITMVGVPSPDEMTVQAFFDVGTVTMSTPTPVSTLVHRGGRSVEYDSTGAELTTIIARLTGLAAQTQYAVALSAAVDVTPAAGTLRVALIDSADAATFAVIQDNQGVANQLDIDATALTSAFTLSTAFFRTPTILPPVVYLSIGFSTAASAGTSLFFDDAIMVQPSLLYPGGPSVAAFTGPTNWVLTDTVSIAMTSNRGGGIPEFTSLQEWMQRALNLRNLGILLPTDGSPTIDDETLLV
jgi:hypothetical protein